MKERLLLLNNYITIGIFIEECEVAKGTGRHESFLPQQTIISQHVIMILLSRNGRYFRVYDNQNHEYYENHITEYVNGNYQTFVEKLLLFRNLYILNQDDIYWSKRLLKSQTNVIPTDKVLEVLENRSNRLLTHWILTPQNTSLSSSSSSTAERHVHFPDEQEEWRRVAEDILAPEANNISVCPFNFSLKLVYTVYIKEDDHHLYDHYLQNHINEFGNTSAKKHQKMPVVNPFLPGYYEYVWTSVIPIEQFQHHRLISSLLTKLHFHFELKKNDYPMEFERVMCTSTDETTNYGQEVKELEALSPYLNPLFASPANIINLEGEETIIKEEELENLYRQTDRDNRFPLFNTLPFFIMKERYEGYDYSNIFPVSSTQIDCEKIVNWIKNLSKSLAEECIVNTSRTNQMEVWACPSQLLQTAALSLPTSPSILYPSLLLFTKDIFHLFKKNKASERVEINSLHSNMMSHLLLTSNMNEFESKHLLSNNTSVQCFASFLKVLPRMMFYSQYLHDIRPIAQHYYQIYYKENYLLKLEKQKTPSTSNILRLERNKPQISEEYVTEEYFEHGLKYTVVVAPDSPRAAPTDIRKIVKIQASFSVDRTIIHYYFLHQRFEVLFTEGQEATFSLDDFQQQRGIFHIVKHHQEQDMTRTTKPKFEEQIISLLPKLDKILRFSHWMQYTPSKREAMLKHQQSVLQQAKAIQYQNYLQLQLQQIHLEYEKMGQERKELERQRRRIKSLVDDDQEDTDEVYEVTEEGKEEEEESEVASNSELEENDDDEEEREDSRRINSMQNPNLSSSSFDTSLLEATFISPYENTVSKEIVTQTPGIFSSAQSQRRRTSLKDQIQEIQSSYELQLKEKEIESTNMKKYILQSVRENLEQSDLVRQRNEDYLRDRLSEARSLCELE